MANKIQVKRGVEANIPILDVGEPAFTTDTKKPFIGTDTGNMELATKEQINDLAVNVKSFGAKGDGITDDTNFVKTAINSANGKQVFFPNGVYVISGLVLTVDTNLVLDKNAVLLAKPNTPLTMFDFSNSNTFTITGGVIDGNKTNQSARTYLITGQCQSGKKLIIKDVEVKDFISSFAYLQLFGGYASITDCIFTGQAEHDGTFGHHTTILTTVSGEDGATSGLVRFNNNRCVGTATPILDGASPGGIFLDNHTPDGDSALGNLSTLEAIGNYFYGYGQMCGGNDISPIHTYPTIDGARIIGNYFEQCGFCAISAKSVQNFVCADNVIVNGQKSTMNIASEGAISYVPAYQAKTNSRPHATITGNIIDNPGEQLGVAKQVGITANGSDVSVMEGVVIANNVITNAGVGITVNYAKDIIIANNIIKGAEGGEAGQEHGIRMDNMQGDVQITGNNIKVNNGHGIAGINLMTNAKIYLVNNVIKHSYGTTPSGYGVILFGGTLIKLVGNEIDSLGTAFSARKDLLNNKIKHFIWDNSNSISGSISITWGDIEKASGFLQSVNSPKNIITPAEIGAMYRQTNGSEGSVVWVATGLTSDSWAPLSDGGAGTPIIEPLTALGTDGTVTIIGNNSEGRIDATVGTAPTGTAIAKITFSKAKTSIPKGVILTPAEGNAAGKVVIVYNTTIKTTDFSISIPTANLVAGTSYKWYYKVMS